MVGGDKSHLTWMKEVVRLCSSDLIYICLCRWSSQCKHC